MARAARGVLVRGWSLNSGDCHALWRVMGTGARRSFPTDRTHVGFQASSLPDLLKVASMGLPFSDSIV